MNNFCKLIGTQTWINVRGRVWQRLGPFVIETAHKAVNESVAEPIWTNVTRQIAQGLGDPEYQIVSSRWVL